MTPRDVHRSGTFVCPTCARFGREDCKEHRATAASALEALVDGASEHGNRYATVCVLLEDVTDETAAEFWAKLNGQEIEIRLDDGCLYIASVETVMGR